MAITKMNSGNYKVEVFYPKEVREILGIKTQRFRKTYSSKEEAKQVEAEISEKTERVKLEKHEHAFELKSTITFQEFYETVWLDMYRNGSSGRSRQIPAEQLTDWIEAIQEDTKKELLTFQDYVLFTLTLNLGDRKSESYALQWKHIDLKKGTILLVQSKDKIGNLTATKGRKNTKFHLPTSLIELLTRWKKCKQKNY